MTTGMARDDPQTLYAATIGAAWLAVARRILADGVTGRYDGLAIREVSHVTLAVANPDPHDEIIARFAEPDRLTWMHANFTDRSRVAALGGADSYATRLFDYEHSGRDQVAWVIDRLRRDPATRSAAITTFQPHTDTTYVPCVSLLDFWLPGGAVELIAYAHSIDFGAKGYGNLVELAWLQRHVAGQLGRPAGRLLMTVKSAHVYETELAYLNGVLAGSLGCRRRADAIRRQDATLGGAGGGRPPAILAGGAMTAVRAVLLLGAGAAAGIVGSAGGTASLISYPALLAAGFSPLAANVTNSVAFVAAWPGSALGSRPELLDQGPRLRRWAPIAVAGSALGAALLLVTPASAFDRVVPFLLAFAALGLLCQPQASAWLARHPAVGRHRFLLPGGLIAVSAYDGYWGAGAGVMTLALLMITTGQQLAGSNALKNMLLGIADVTCCVVFILCWPVDWTAVAPMAAGVLLGSMVGPSLTRRLPGHLLRVIAALAGLGLAIHLWVGR